MNLIETLEKEEIARLSEGKTFPKMNPGDTVVVNVNVVEGCLLYTSPSPRDRG